ncbi:MAG: TetR family transcriptional regulator [Planctomycetes bacterium]|nr:TetR family transcriptional regulator [Planctomycetota bacterium]
MTATTDTRERLLDVAEVMFAERGVRETSLRGITQKAGTNLAAVNYHFGSKNGLVGAVFQRRLGPINAERLRRLDEAERVAAGGPVTLEAILRAFLEPALHGRRDAHACFVLVARAHLAPDPELRAMLMSAFDAVAARFGAALQASLPGIPPTEFFWRMHFLIGSLCHTVVNGALLEDISGGLCRGDDDEEILARLVSFGAAGLRAAVDEGAREASSSDVAAARASARKRRTRR